MQIHKYLIITIFFILPSIVFAQNFHIKGTVIDKNEREPLAFSNVFIPQLKDGFLTDENGEFSKLFSSKVDSIVFTYIGYKPFTLKLPIENPEEVLIEMESISSELDQVVVYAPRKREKDTTAWRIYKNVVENKPINRPTSHEYFEYEEYSKIVGSFYNFSPKLLNRKIIRPFKFVLENYDSTSDGRLFIPLILKEEITQVYYQKKPEKDKKIVLAQKVSGIEQVQISNLLNIVLNEMDVYSNELTVSGFNFMLPFADGAWFKYRFYVIDSAQNNRDEWVYHIGFAPNIKGELAFLGEAWIHAPTYAIQKIDLKIEKNANLNFVNDFTISQNFELINNKYWVKVRDLSTSGISITQRKKSKMVHIEQLKIFDKFKINEAIEDSIFKSKRLYAENYRKKSDEFWEENRQENLSISQNNVYYLIDSLKRTKAYKRYTNAGRTIVTGFYKTGPIDFGNLYNMLSYNPIEGYRIRLTTKSNRDLSEKFWYNLYGAYGTNDKKYKYGVELKYKFIREDSKIHEIGIKYKDDYQRFSLANTNSNEYDYVLNTFLRKNAFKDLVYVRDFSIYHKKEWNSVLMSDFSGNFKQYKTVPGLVDFTTTQSDGTQKVVDGFRMVNPRIEFEITPGAKYLYADGKRILIKSKLPRIVLDYTFSKKGLLGSDFNFQSIGLNISQRIPSLIGWTRYTLSANKLFGEIPYPLLFIHQGNENFLRDNKRFSNMKEGEYAADQEITLLFEHHFGGFFFNKIPLVKKLKLREVFLCKIAYSSLDKNKSSFLDMPDYLTGLNGFYAELGFGIENILKMVEVQFSWRMTQRDLTDANRFVIKFWVSPSF